MNTPLQRRARQEQGEPDELLAAVEDRGVFARGAWVFAHAAASPMLTDVLGPSR